MASTSGKKPRAVRIWGEVGVTMAVTQDPPQFVKVSFGHERVAPDDSEETLKKYRRKIRRFNEESVEEEAERLRRLILATLEQGEESDTSPRRRTNRS